MAHHAELERVDLERLAGGSLGGVLLALYCGLDGWDVTLLATLAGTLGLVVPCFYADHGPAKATSVDRPRQPATAVLGSVSHA